MRKVDRIKYQSLIGTLMYLAVTTRPQKNQDPHIEYEAAAKHIVRYLSVTKHLKLHFRKTGTPAEGFVDANWGGSIEDRKSYTGYVFKLADCVKSLESKKQCTTALSSTEAEYMALTAR